MFFFRWKNVSSNRKRWGEDITNELLIEYKEREELQGAVEEIGEIPVCWFFFNQFFYIFKINTQIHFLFSLYVSDTHTVLISDFYFKSG